MRVAVTGGRGFIGDRLVQRLVDRGDRVRVLTRRPGPAPWLGVDLVYGGLADASGDALARLVDGVDVVYHCAGEVRDPALMHAVHVVGTRQLIDAAGGKIGRWVQLSSVGVYGPVHTGVVTEDWPESPVGQYERTKTEADNLVRTAAADGAFSAVMLRPSNVYGPTMRNRYFFQLMRTIDRGIFFFIGPPGASANYIHVDNVVDAAIACGTDPRASGRTYIVSDHRDLEAFVGEIAMLLGRRSPRLRMPTAVAKVASQAGTWLPGFPLTPARVAALTTQAVYSAGRIERELGYVNRISMEEGLRQMVQVVRER